MTQEQKTLLLCDIEDIIEVLGANSATTLDTMYSLHELYCTVDNLPAIIEPCKGVFQTGSPDNSLKALGSQLCPEAVSKEFLPREVEISLSQPQKHQTERFYWGDQHQQARLAFRAALAGK